MLGHTIPSGLARPSARLEKRPLKGLCTKFQHLVERQLQDV